MAVIQVAVPRSSTNTTRVGLLEVTVESDCSVVVAVVSTHITTTSNNTCYVCIRVALSILILTSTNSLEGYIAIVVTVVESCELLLITLYKSSVVICTTRNTTYSREYSPSLGVAALVLVEDICVVYATCEVGVELNITNLHIESVTGDTTNRRNNINIVLHLRNLLNCDSRIVHAVNDVDTARKTYNTTISHLRSLSVVIRIFLAGNRMCETGVLCVLDGESTANRAALDNRNLLRDCHNLASKSTIASCVVRVENYIAKVQALD